MSNSNIDHIEKSTKWLLLFTALCVFSFDLKNLYNLWQLDPAGLTLGIKTQAKLPYWDFSNLWSSALFAREGHVNWLFDTELYRAKLDELFQATLEPQEWSYPPHVLLVGTPLSYLPIFWAYIIWTLGGLLAFGLTLRHFKLPQIIFFFVFLSPAIWKSLLFGQNGAIVAALFIAGLYYADKKPILAGIMFGILTMKPHLGILIPFILIINSNWRAFISASLTSIILIVFTYALYGIEVWQDFLDTTRPLMTLILEADFPASYHTNMITAFALARSLGASIFASYGIQIVFSVTAIIAIILLWRPNCKIDEKSRIILTGLCALIATPYAYNYDGAIYYLAIAWYLCHAVKPNVIFVALLWITPLYWPKIISLGLPAIGILPLILIAVEIYKMERTKEKLHPIEA